MTGYRTYIVSALLALSGVLAQTDWVEFVANPKAGMVAIGSAVLMAFMRSITKTSPGVAAAIEVVEDVVEAEAKK